MSVNGPDATETCHCTVGVGEPLAAAVNVTGEPACTLWLTGSVVTVTVVLLIGTLLVLLAEQPPAFVTTRVRSTVPDAPAVYVMVWMLVAEVIVPLTIDQAYVVAPAGPSAVLPTEFPQSVAGVGVMVGVDGFGLIGMLMVLLAEQPAALVTTN